MFISKIDRIGVLEKIHRGESLPSDEKHYNICFELLEDNMIVSATKDSPPHLSYIGLRELEDWDPLLKVSVNNQLLLKPHGDA